MKCGLSHFAALEPSEVHTSPNRALWGFVLFWCWGDVCVCKTGIDTLCLPLLLPTGFLPELANSARLAGQEFLGVLLVLLPCAGVTRTHCHAQLFTKRFHSELRRAQQTLYRLSHFLALKLTCLMWPPHTLTLKEGSHGRSSHGSPSGRTLRRLF